jgi:hypothetical protein
MKPTPTRPMIALRLAIAIAIGVGPVAARADVGLRVPAEATPDEVAAITAALKKAQPKAVRVFVAAPTPPPATPPLAATERLERARKAYKNLELDAARTDLAAAETACLAGGSCGACRDLLFDAHLLAGAIAVSLGQDEVAAAEFVTAHAAQLSRVVDPRRFPPKIVGAFNRACADMENLPPAAIRVGSEPKGASLWLNGAPIQADGAVEVRARRVYVEARLAGFAPRCEALDPAAGPSSTLRLSAIAADKEPDEAARLLAAADPALDAAAIAFLGRIGLDRFVSLSLAAQPSRFTVRAARTGMPTWVELPPLSGAADAGSAQFTEALATALGDPPAVEVVPVPPPPDPLDDDPDGLDDEEEDDSIMLDPDVGDPPDDGTGSGSKILKSPWLWISIGVVVAVVGGVVIGTQVSD